MFTPETSKHFKKYVDESGVVSYILTTRVAPVQQGYYYTNSCMTDDGRYLWFWVKYPPAIYEVSAVLDFETDEITVHHETTTAHGVPHIDKKDGSIIHCNGAAIYRSYPGDCENQTVLVKKKAMSYTPFDRFQKNLQGDRPINFRATHFILANDNKTMLIDSQYTVTGTKVGTVNIETGEFTEWKSFDGVLYNHSAICPTNPELGMINEDFHINTLTGEYKLIRFDADGNSQRIVLINKNGETEIIPPMFKERATHEWWAADGKSLYSVDMTMGLCRYTLEDKKWELRVPGKAWHGHCSKDEKYYVSDIDLVEQNFRGCESAVRFYNYETKKDVMIITKNPRWNEPDNQNNFHMDPHPGFNCNDKYIVHTTTVDGHIDVALTPTTQLIEMTK